MTVVRFTVTFHSPFRVGAAYASDGVGAAIDHDDPLPADSIKGVMRAAAADLLGTSHPAVREVFGDKRTPSPWAWSSATPSQKPAVTQRHRVSIDAEHHAARKDALVLGEQAWMPAATFVHGLGAWRRRGLGWVGITPKDGAVSADEVTRLLSMRSAVR